MTKQTYHDADKIMMCIAEAEQLRIDNDNDLAYFIKTRTGYDINSDNLQYHKQKFVKEYRPNYTTWLRNFAQNKVLQTASTHLEVLEEIRNDFFYIYQNKSKAYKEKLAEGIEPDPMELTELLDVKGAVTDVLDHIEKRNLALLYIIPFKITMDKQTNQPKLDKADPDTRTAILVSELEAEQIEEHEEKLRNYTEVHGEENLTA